MKIVEMRVTPIAVGDPPLLNAAGLHAPFAPGWAFMPVRY